MTYSRCKRIDLQTTLEARNHTNHPSQNSPRGPHFVPNHAYRKRPARSISVSPSSPSIQAFHSLRLAKSLTSKPLPSRALSTPHHPHPKKTLPATALPNHLTKEFPMTPFPNRHPIIPNPPPPPNSQTSTINCRQP